jgi:cytochrome P450
MYHLLKNPSSLSRLRKEIDDAVAEGRISQYVTWTESQTLPYLEACVNEATRMYPPFGLPFERVVPAAGLDIEGYFIPGGTRIGIARNYQVPILSYPYSLGPLLIRCVFIQNPWTVQRDVSLFGEDAETWRPERWLCDKDRKAAMQNGILTVCSTSAFSSCERYLRTQCLTRWVY